MLFGILDLLKMGKIERNGCKTNLCSFGSQNNDEKKQRHQLYLSRTIVRPCHTYTNMATSLHPSRPTGSMRH